MMHLLQITLNQSDLPYYKQISNAIRDAICKGIYGAREKLPSTRELAASLQINRHTVRFAYEELHAEGWIDTYERKGYFVSSDIQITQQLTTNSNSLSKKSIVLQHLLVDSDLQKKSSRKSSTHHNVKYNLESSVPDLRLLPWEELKTCFHRALKIPAVHMDFHGAQGDPLLLEAIYKIMRQQRHLNHHDIILTYGSQEALFITSQLLIKPGDFVGVEEKGYKNAWKCFQHFGAQIVPLKIDHEGLVPESLELAIKQHPLKLVYLTPLHQFPTTVTLSPSRRLKIMHILAQHNIPLIEDDYDHDVHFDSHIPLPLAADDPHKLVIYITTLSKVVVPGARIGILAVPKDTFDMFLKTKTLTSRTSETLIAHTIAYWINDGGFERHMRRIRKIYKQRLLHLTEQLTEQKFFKEQCSFISPSGGMNLWLNLNTHPQNICHKALQNGLSLSSEELYLPINNRHLAKHIRMSYASLNEMEMNKALEILKHSMKNCTSHNI